MSTDKFAPEVSGVNPFAQRRFSQTHPRAVHDDNARPVVGHISLRLDSREILTHQTFGADNGYFIVPRPRVHHQITVDVLEIVNAAVTSGGRRSEGIKLKTYYAKQ